MPADVEGEVVSEDLGVGERPAGDVLAFGEFAEGDPAWEDDVDDHEGFWGGGVDEDVAWFVVGAFVAQPQCLISHSYDLLFLKNDIWKWTRWVQVRAEALQDAACVDVSDVLFDCGVEEGCAAVVVGVRVAVDEVRDGLVCDCFYGQGDFVPDCWGRIDEYYALCADEEEGLVGALGYHVGAVAEVLDAVAELGVDGRTVCGAGNGEVGCVGGVGAVVEAGDIAVLVLVLVLVDRA